MGFWQRLWSRKTALAPDDAWDILVISDIHLGEDILIGGPEHLSEYIRSLNRELADFIAEHREGAAGRRWHLVINGDMFDFVKVSLQRTDEAANFEQWARNGGDEQDAADLPNTAENVVWKLQRILEIHRPLFKQMARFLLDGHKITIIEGNHDAEFFFDDVQRTFRQSLVALAEKYQQQSKAAQYFDAAEVGQRLQFGGWFFAEHQRLHIEHGHQYDEYCSFEYNLAPLDRQDARTLATPFTHRLIPYFAEIFGDFSTHGIEQWRIKDHLRFVFALGPKALLFTVRMYFSVGLGLVGRAGARRQAELASLAQAHADRLKELAETSPYSHETLLRLDKLKARPAEFSVWRMLHGFYLDRLLLGALGLLLLPVALLVGGAVGWSLAAVALVIAAVNWMLAKARAVDVSAMLRRSAAGIATHTGSRFVVFGHSHHAELVDLAKVFGLGGAPQGAYYLNSGSWVTREILRGEEGTGMTFVEIVGRHGALKR